MGYYWPSMKKDFVVFMKKCHGCQVQENLIHTNSKSLQSMVTSWPFHTWGLDLIGLVNPPSNGNIWILVAIEYFTKWVEAILLRKATRGIVANFIKEIILARFGRPHRIISDIDTCIVNKEVRKMLEYYQVKQHWSSPYYP